MGTLIPLSPALAGLAAGDVQELSDNLRIAFSVTVLGLLIGAIAFGISLVQGPPLQPGPLRPRVRGESADLDRAADGAAVAAGRKGRRDGEEAPRTPTRSPAETDKKPGETDKPATETQKPVAETETKPADAEEKPVADPEKTAAAADKPAEGDSTTADAGKEATTP